MLAHAAIGKVFDIPVVMTTSAQTGPNGPLPKEILEMYPNAPLIMRNGEVNAWDNAEFRDAIRSFNKSQIIMAGIVTDVCMCLSFRISLFWLDTLTVFDSGTTFLALSLRAEGYSVWANVEASGTTTPLIRDVSNFRMANAGVQVVSLFSIICDLMRDWRNTPGALEIIPYLDKYYPAYAYVARAHGHAVRNGTIIPGQAQLL